MQRWVRLQVRRASQGRQIPWESTSLEDDFVFGQSGFRTKLTFWYEPGWGYSVRMRRDGRTRSGAPDVSIREVIARSRKG